MRHGWTEQTFQAAEPLGSFADGCKYTVESIVAATKSGAKWFYLVKWMGYSNPTWEPESFLVDMDEEIRQGMSKAKGEYLQTSGAVPAEVDATTVDFDALPIAIVENRRMEMPIEAVVRLVNTQCPLPVSCQEDFNAALSFPEYETVIMMDKSIQGSAFFGVCVTIDQFKELQSRYCGSSAPNSRSNKVPAQLRLYDLPTWRRRAYAPLAGAAAERVLRKVAECVSGVSNLPDRQTSEWPRFATSSESPSVLQFVVRVAIGVTTSSGQLMIAAGTAIGEGSRSSLCLPGGVVNVCESNSAQPTAFAVQDGEPFSMEPRYGFDRPSTRKPPTARIRCSFVRGDRVDRDSCFELLKAL